MKRLALILLVLCVAGCSVARYPYEQMQRDSTYTSRVDSIYIFDSVYVDRFVTVKSKADTVYVTDYKTEYKYRYRDRTKTDTLYLDKIKTVTETKLVEKELTPWQAFRLKGFWWLLGIVAAFALWKVAKIFIRL